MPPAAAAPHLLLDERGARRGDDPAHAFLCPSCTQINSETDFVARNEQFMRLVNSAAAAAYILDGPLIRWDDHVRPNADAAPQHVRALLADNLAINPLFQPFETMLEVDHPSRGVPVLTARAVAGIVADGIARDPLNRRTERQRDFAAFKLSAVVAAVPDLPRQPRDNVLRAGTLHLRAAGLARRMLNVDASRLNIDETFDEESITLEAALFPFLFPSGRGFYEGHGTLTSNPSSG